MAFRIKVDPFGSSIPSPIPRPDTLQGRATVMPRERLPQGLYVNIPKNSRDIEDVMREAISTEEPKAVRFLVNTINAQKDAIKAQEIANAIRDGSFSRSTVSSWRESYAEFVNDKLDPIWRRVANNAHDFFSEAIGTVLEFETPNWTQVSVRLQEWIDFHAGSLIQSLTQNQSLAVTNLLRHFTVDVPLNARSLARYIRPIIGLTPTQTGSIIRMREELVASGLKEDTVVRRVELRTEKMIRTRANTIARTETAMSWNNGGLAMMREVEEMGLVTGNVYKVFYTSEDERVCAFCGPLHEQRLSLNQTFPGLTEKVPNVFVPPVHPNCRCSVSYEVEGGVTDV